VRLDPDTEELVREWAEEHDVSLSAAVNGMLREWADSTFVEAPPLVPARAQVASARGLLPVNRHRRLR